MRKFPEHTSVIPAKTGIYRFMSRQIPAFAGMILLFFLLISPAAYCETPPQKLTLILDWFINSDHAPIIVAQEKGFFKEQGLEVELINPADPNDPPKLVATGKADIGISYEPEFIDQVEQGLPLISIGSLINKPMNCIVVFDKGPIKSLADLKGKRIGLGTDPVLKLMLQAMLKKQGIELKDVELIPTRNNLVQSLLAGKVDAITGVMRNIEGVEVELLDYKARLFLPEKNGIPLYSELIYVIKKDGLNDPIKRQNYAHFLQAIEKATQYLKAHPEESWQAFAQQYPALSNPFTHRTWQASIPHFSNHPRQFSAQEWRAFIGFMRQNDFIKSQRELSDYYTEIRA